MATASQLCGSITEKVMEFPSPLLVSGMLRVPQRPFVCVQKLRLEASTFLFQILLIARGDPQGVSFVNPSPRASAL